MAYRARVCWDCEDVQKRVLINAVVRNNITMCHVLLESGASVNDLDEWEKTALIYASGLGN